MFGQEIHECPHSQRQPLMADEKRVNLLKILGVVGFQDRH